MTAKTITFKVMRSKKTGRYFKFVEYTCDGWGKYEGTINADYIYDNSDIPTLFRSDFDPNPKINTISEIVGHTLDEVEFVPITITIGDE